MSMTSFELPASFAQRRFWWLDRLDPGLPTYNVPWSVELTGPLDEQALRSVLQSAVDRHEALRTTLREADGDPVQVVADHLELAWHTMDVSTAADPMAAAAARAVKLARQPFDLERGPLVRVELLRLAPEHHRLVLVCHHAVSDGWSFGVLFDELVAEYNGGHPEPPPIQYADFAAWQAQQKDAWAQAEQYWRAELAGAPTTLELAGVRPRPNRPSYAGHTFEFLLGQPLSAAVRQTAREAGTTVFAVLLAGFAATVARMAGRDDVLVGVPVSGRVLPETENVFGLFTNTVPLRLRLGEAGDFRTLVAQARANVAEALTHQDYPFDRIVELANLTRDITRSPLVQVFFQFEDSPRSVRHGDLTWSPIIMDNGGAKFDLSVATHLMPDGEIAGWFNYATDLYDEAWANRFLDLYRGMLAAATAAPTARLSTLDYLPAAERQLVTREWATGAALPDGPWTAAELLAGAPGLPAAARQDARHVAGALRALGVGPEQPVGIYLARDERLIPAVLGCWWAGAAYVPLDPNLPPARLAAMVADSGLRVVIGGDHPAEPLGEHVRVLPYKEALSGDPIDPVPVPPTAAAYTIFTSGSTGRPKGVTVTQGNVASMLRAFQGILPLGPGDHLVAITTLSFDISVLELLLPPLCGCRVTVADAQTATDANALRRLLQESGATALQATPATWRALHLTGGIPATVRLRLCGGEALPPDLAEALTTDGAQVWNVYGPTETTVWSAAGVVTRGEPVRIGPPIPGTRLYVLDDSLLPVPPTVTGQLFIGGPGVARGYHGRPDLTARQFIPDPFSDDGGRLYATGDLGRWTADGRIELLGRNDHQVKIRGFRIELGEVESVLRAHPLVDDAVVVVRGEGEGRHLAAFVSARAAELDEESLREHLVRQLPAYLVPAGFAILDRLPLNASGKVDRSALPDLVPTRRGGTPPTSPTQVALAELWRDVLGVPTVAVEDDFFALGGHSLDATRLLFRIRQSFGIEVSLRDFYAAPTLGDCARLIDETVVAGTTAAPTIGRIDRSQLMAGPR